ncbi:MAG: hypothetical protein ACYC2T_03760 [Bacillota bacterium]
MGGNHQTTWERTTHHQDGSGYCLYINNPSCSEFVGIQEDPPQLSPVYPGEIWEVAASMQAGASQSPLCLHVFFLDDSGQTIGTLTQEFPAVPEMTTYRLKYIIPGGIRYTKLEIGTTGPQQLWVDQVQRMPSPHLNVSSAQTIPDDHHGIYTGAPSPWVNQYYVSWSRGNNSQPPQMEFSRQNSQLKGFRAEEITFTPPPRSEVLFFAFSFSCTGPSRLVFSPSPYRFSVPPSELHWIVPQKIPSVADQPLIIRVINESSEPIAYIFHATGLWQETINADDAGI